MPKKSVPTAAHALIAALAAASLACQPLAVVPGAGVPAPAAGAALATATFALPADARAAARERLAGTIVDDFTRSLLGGQGRSGAARRGAAPDLAGAIAPGRRRLQAFGDPSTAAWAGGVALTALGCSGTDMATNGAATRNFTPYLANRLFVLTREGRLLDLDPAAPATGYVSTTLAGTFSKTYVTLSGDGRVAFAVNDAGTVYAVDLVNTVASAHPTRTLALGKACVNGALFADPLASDTVQPNTTMYIVANDGTAYRIAYGATLATPFASATFTSNNLGLATGITTPLAGTELVKAPCVALGGQLVVGDRRGWVNLLNTTAGTLQRWRTNPGWAIETPIAVDVDDNLTITDLFAACGGQLFWVKPATGAVYPGQYALVENRAINSGTITAGSASTYLSLNNTTVRADNTYKALSLYKHATDDTVDLPNQTSFVDEDRVSHCEFMTGQPPSIDAYVGPTGRSYGSFSCWTFNDPPTHATGAGISPPVADGTVATAAQLQGPIGIEVMDDGTTFPADDGSLFIGDSDHAQVLFKPATPTSGQKWATSGTLAGTLDPSKVYVFAGTLNGDAVWNDGDVGNGAGGPIKTRPTRLAVPGAVARGTPINLIFGLAIGNLGVYISQLNKNTSGAYKDGAVLFVPRVGVTAAFGMTGLVPGQMYVLTTDCNPQGLAVDRTVAGRDTLYMASFDWAGASNRNTIMKLDSNVATDATVFASGLLRPVDVCLDDLGNLFTAESNGNRVSMYWDTRGLGAANTRTWGIGSPVANTRYTVKSGFNQPQTVTFALNDPQVPSGCLYVGNTGDHTIRRLDEGANMQTVAGNGSSGDTGDGGSSTAARVNYPHRAKGDGKGTTYVADRFNNRIRIMTSPVGSGIAQSYMSFDASTFQSRAIYAATLTLTSQTVSGTLAAPVVGLADPYLLNTTTVWSAASLAPTKSPLIDVTTHISTPAAATWSYVLDSTHTYSLPVRAVPTSPLAEGGAIRLGMVAPVDTTSYYFPTGIGLPTGATKAPEFYTHKAATATKRPTVAVTHGQYSIARSILSPPAIWFNATKRYIYVANANALFRYDATTPGSFTAGVDFTLSTAGRTANGTLYTVDNTFQPNPTPPMLSYDGTVHFLDIKAASATNYAYNLVAMNGDAASADMWLTRSTAIGTGLAGTFADNAGIYMVSGGYSVDEALFGLANRRIYRVTLNP